MSGSQAAFYVPVGFDSSEFPPPERDYAHYVLNLLHWRYVNWRADEAGFVHLMWKYVTRVIPRDWWPTIRRRLTDDEREGGPVVEWDYRAARGKAFGFRLAPGYRKVRRVVCTNDGLNRRIRNLTAERDRTLLPVHRWLVCHLDRLDFDLDRALSVVSTLRPDRRETEDSTIEYRVRLVGQCERLAGGDRYLVCDRFGRVHTPVTSLPRHLRCCLSVGGEPLAGLDLANSQPLVAGLLARRFCRSRSVRSRMCGATFEGAGNPYCYKALADLGDHPDVPADVRAYLRCCAAGTFYESFTPSGGDRDRVKRGFMSVLMGPNRYRGPVKAAFAARYPTVAGMLRDLKRKEHARAAWLLQNLEATVFIHAVCGRLMDRRPDLPVFTVHDCLFTVPGGLASVRAAVLEEFGQLGVVPTLKPC